MAHVTEGEFGDDAVRFEERGWGDTVLAILSAAVMGSCLCVNARLLLFVKSSDA